MRSRMPVSSAWALRATLGVASTMAPRLRRNPCTVSRYHWMVRKGSLASSRRAAIRLIRQADQVDPQTLLAHHHAVQLRHVLQLRGGRTTALALWAGAGDISVLGYLHRNPGQVNHFPSALGPATGQLGSAVGTLFHHVFHPLGGRPAGASKAVGPRLAWFLGLGRLLLGFGLQTGHPAGAAQFVPPFQLGDPFLQALDDALLPLNRWQSAHPGPQC